MHCLKWSMSRLLLLGVVLFFVFFCLYFIFWLCRFSVTIIFFLHIVYFIIFLNVFMKDKWIWRQYHVILLLVICKTRHFFEFRIVEDLVCFPKTGAGWFVGNWRRLPIVKRGKERHLSVCRYFGSDTGGDCFNSIGHCFSSRFPGLGFRKPGWL